MKRLLMVFVFMAVSVLFGVVYGILVQNPPQPDERFRLEQSKQSERTQVQAEKNALQDRDDQAVEAFLPSEEAEGDNLSPNWLGRMGNQFDDTLTSFFTTITSVLD